MNGGWGKRSEETYKKANQEFQGKFKLDRDVTFSRIIDPQSIKTLLGDDWEKNEQYCSLCPATNIKDFHVMVAVSEHNIPQSDGKELMLLICEKCRRGQRKNN